MVVYSLRHLVLTVVFAGSLMVADITIGRLCNLMAGK